MESISETELDYCGDNSVWVCRNQHHQFLERDHEKAQRTDKSGQAQVDSQMIVLRSIRPVTRPFAFFAQILQIILWRDS